MTQILSDLSEGARVAIIRLRSLGDCVLTTPAISLLKSERPDLRIAIVVEPRFAGVFEGNPDIDSIVEPKVSAVARLRPELVLNFHGGTRSLILTSACNARLRAGFAHHRGAAFYNIRIPTAQQILGVDRTVHTAEHLASAIFYLGASLKPIPRAKLFAEPHGADRPYVIIHPFASSPGKTWAPGKFIAAASDLLQQHSLQPVFIGGPGDDLAPFRQFRTVSASGLSETKSLLAGASLFLGNDSGPAHMAAAFGVPVIVLFGPSDSVIWAPWQVESEVICTDGPIDSIPLERVSAAVDRLRVAQ